jgi:hypothetical protein
MALVDRIVQALEALGGIASYSELYAYLEKNSPAPLPKYWKDSVRGRIEENSSDSRAFKGKRDLFYAAQGLGNGVWGLKSKLSKSIVAIDVENLDELQKIREGNLEPYKVETEITRIIRDTMMTKQLKTIYQYKCQICDKAIFLHERLYAEAHHLRPLGGIHRGTDDANNILIVCPNHHVEFDYGAIAIHPVEMTVLHIDPYYSLIGKPVLFHLLHKINELNLGYHIDNVFQGN